MPPSSSLVLGTVLLVEDEPEARAPIEARLSTLGYRVLTASDGAEALKLLDQEEISVVVLDPGLPRLDGYRLLEILQRDPQLMDLPVIVTSGAAYDSRLKGAVAYLKKPFALDALVALVERWHLEVPHLRPRIRKD